MENEMKRVASFAALDSTTNLPVLTLARSGLYYDGKRRRIVCSACQKDYPTTATDFCLHTSASSLSSTSPEKSEAEALQSSISLLETASTESSQQLKDVALACLRRLSGQRSLSTGMSAGRSGMFSHTISVPKEPYIPIGVASTSTPQIAPDPTTSAPSLVDLSQLLQCPTTQEEAESHYRARLRSYIGTPERVEGPTKEALAWFGYKYCGPDDKVRCTYCNGNLRDWEDGDDPLEEHKRWYSNCPFLPFIMSLHIHEDVKRANTMKVTSRALNINAQSYRIEPREIKARLDGTSARAIMDMGYSRELLSAVIEEQLRNTGDDFKSVTEMLEAVFKKAEDTKSPGPMGASNWVPNLPTPSTSISTLDAVLGPDNIEIVKHPDDDFQPTGKKKKKKKTKKPVLPVVVPTLLPVEEPVDEEYAQLKAENEELKSNRLCKICMTKEMDTVFLPCGHLMTCGECACKIKDCCMCRTFIRGTVKTFLS